MKAKIKIGILTVAIVLVAETVVKGQGGWTASSPYVYTTTGTDRVGIGISTPSYPLHIF